MGRKKRVTYSYSTEDEQQKVSALEDFLFGDGAAAAKVLVAPDRDDIANIVRQAAEAPDSDDEQAGGSDGGDDDDDLFVEDRRGEPGSGSGDDGDEAGPGPGSEALQLQQQQQQQGRGAKGGKRRRPVWTDPADASLSVDVASVPRLRKLRASKGQTAMSGAEYEAALRRQHAALHPRTSWAAHKVAAAGRGRGGGGGGGGDAEPDDADEPDEDAAAALLRSAGGLLAGGGTRGLLAPQVLELSRLRDANGSSPSDAVVQSLQFHPNGQLLLTAGFDKRLKLFQVDGLRNPLVQSLFLEDTPIQTAAFAAGGAQVVAAGRRPFYYVADLASGALERVIAPPCLHLRGGAGGGGKKTRGTGGGGGMRSCETFVVSPDASRPLVAFLGDGGHVGLVALSSRSPVGGFKMNGSARAAAFSSDGSSLVTAGGDGVLYTWDLRSQRPLHTQRDEGALGCSSLALSPDGGYLASGDSSGVVNVYERRTGLLSPLLGDDGGGGDDSLGLGFGGAGSTGGAGGGQAALIRLKSLMNLTTAVDTLSFSHDGQLLLMGSRLKREALRLVHLPSLTVFQNWPTSKSPLHYVHSAAFSPHSGFLGVGNAKGRALLYRLHHYPDA